MSQKVVICILVVSALFTMGGSCNPRGCGKDAQGIIGAKIRGDGVVDHDFAFRIFYYNPGEESWCGQTLTRVSRGTFGKYSVGDIYPIEGREP